MNKKIIQRYKDSKFESNINKVDSFKSINEKTINFSSICKIYIYIFCIYISFETIILNILPSFALGIVRYGLEALGYGLLVLFFILFLILRRGKIYVGQQEKAIFILLLIMIINIFINLVDLKIAILGIRWIIRYVYIYFLILLSNWSEKDINKFINLIKFIMLIEIGLCIFQLVNRDIADVFLLPQYDSIIEGIDSYAKQGTSKYAIYASFGRYNEFGYFILYALWIWIAELCCTTEKKENLKVYCMLIIWFIILIFSYNRQHMVALIVSGAIFILNYNNIKLSRRQVAMLVIIIALILSASVVFLSGFESGRGILSEGIAQRFLSIFSKEFIKADFIGKGRTWFYTVGLYKLLSYRPLLGAGVGRYGCQTAIQYDDSVYQLLDIPTIYSMDVYITSIIGQIGIIGFIALFYMYFVSLKNSVKIINKKNATNLSRKISIITYGYCIAGLVATFFSSSLSDRYLAFYLWCMIAFQKKLSYKTQENRKK